ncbi:nickel pincer cofactor biosynthesis protein LarC [Pelovirga terrestris]|uniref:Putative nickel insertion protein n=1 Tax=Pelovirga terrestris TaxID=2771352 RepID=A0A8J6QVB9_9BACT|nr:nickel pincer cofactor biosynthesis protein LarC [Pelovirga terrestris]MBD1401510.1 nickel pincer cofactor biosynthesis protein LarC [Pelovirga terrestris]
MKTLYLDTFSGISGDMFLGLLCDLGLDVEQLKAELAKLPVSDYQVNIKRERRHGIEGCRFSVNHQEDHHHRSWSHIDQMLAESHLSERSKELARRFFRRLGEAEAKVHGISIDEVHFHEVGAVDAIVDLTGAAIGIDLLGINKVFCSPLPLSRGIGQCAHGALPLPAPATVEILQGRPVYDSGCDKELVTPTGATLVRELAEFTPLPDRAVGRVGYGVGGWELADRPNLLRGILYAQEHQPTTSDAVELLESHIDDSTPEQLGDLLERLFEAGALDAAYVPLQMKKNRPGQLLKVVCQPAHSQTLATLIMHHSSAIGVRSQPCHRYRLQRHEVTIATTLGTAGVKLLFDHDQFLRLSAEYDDCRRLARQHNLPLQQVYRLVENSAYDQLPQLLKETNHD